GTETSPGARLWLVRRGFLGMLVLPQMVWRGTRVRWLCMHTQPGWVTIFMMTERVARWSQEDREPGDEPKDNIEDFHHKGHEFDKRDAQD
ncbi:unnamed protein product, partial [Choristocarpus tenellus]